MQVKDPLFHLLKLDDIVTVVDIGANPIDGDAPYKEMLKQGLCRVFGFEPQVDAWATLNARKSELETYLPYAIGDGTRKSLHICYASGMTSTLEPSSKTLALFNEFAQFGSVVNKTVIETKRLDDVSEVNHVDFLKIDVQGGELDVFKSGRAVLETCVAIQTEVSFIPLYKDQPSFGEVDVYMRSIGFLPHCLPAVKLWPLAPMVVSNNPKRPLNQLLEADIVYVRNFIDHDAMTDGQWKRLAFIAHHVYRSFDLALRCIQVCEQAGTLDQGTDRKYLELASAVKINV